MVLKSEHRAQLRYLTENNEMHLTVIHEKFVLLLCIPIPMCAHLFHNL